MRLFRLTALAALALSAAACSSGGGDATPTTQPVAVGADDTAAGSRAGVRLVSVTEGQNIIDNPPADLVVLDVRTPDEFDAGHIDGAIMIDFYEDGFVDRIADLDPDVPYLLYCRSGSRSGQTAALMADLGFSDVADVDGGVLAWSDAGLPLATG